MTLAEQLSQLADLHKRGIISPAEFEAAKSRLLSGEPAPSAPRPASAATPAATPARPWMSVWVLLDVVLLAIVAILGIRQLLEINNPSNKFGPDLSFLLWQLPLILVMWTPLRLFPRLAALSRARAEAGYAMHDSARPGKRASLLRPLAGIWGSCLVVWVVMWLRLLFYMFSQDSGEWYVFLLITPYGMVTAVVLGAAGAAISLQVAMRFPGKIGRVFGAALGWALLWLILWVIPGGLWGLLELLAAPLALLLGEDPTNNLGEGVVILLSTVYFLLLLVPFVAFTVVTLLHATRRGFLRAQA